MQLYDFDDWSQPVEWTDEQCRQAATYLSGKSLSDLRQRQSTNRGQIASICRRLTTELSSKSMLEKGLDNLRVMEKVLTDAVMRREFPVTIRS